MTVIPEIIAKGYGVSFRDIKKIQSADENTVLFEFPTKLKQGDLCLILSEMNGIIIPGIRIGDEVTVCIAFYTYIHGVGWRMLDLRTLPQSIDDVETDEIKIKTLEPNLDMTGYEIVEGFDRRAQDEPKP